VVTMTAKLKRIKINLGMGQWLLKLSHVPS